MKHFLKVAALIALVLVAVVGWHEYSWRKDVRDLEKEREIRVTYINHETNQYVYEKHTVNGHAKITAFCDAACPSELGTFDSADVFKFRIEKEEMLDK